MTTRMEILDLIDRTLTEHLGPEKVSRRADGVLIVAGRSEAFAIQALTIEAGHERTMPRARDRQAPAQAPGNEPRARRISAHVPSRESVTTTIARPLATTRYAGTKSG